MGNNPSLADTLGSTLGSTLFAQGNMGNVGSCSSKGALLLVAAANGDLPVAQEILRTHPRAALYYNFKDRSSPLIQAAARGHFELVQQLLEAAVISEGPERAKRHCIDHANIKRQTALMVACKHGHPDCVEYLVTNGADPLLTDERRHNTCLHFAALYGHSECVHKLLGCRAGTGQHTQGDAQMPVARITCTNDVDGSQVQFVDGHNGWGLTALHIAVFQGSVNTVKVLLRHGASLEVVISPPRVENSPIRCAAGSNALHIAALIGNISMAKLVLEAQEAFPGLELRSHVDALGMRPHEYAQRARNPVMLHLLDERLPVHLLRQIWLNYSLDSGLPARHNTLASMLQKLKLMFNLEVIAIQRQITLLDASAASPTAPVLAPEQQRLAHSNDAPPSLVEVAAPPAATTAAGNGTGTAGAASEVDLLWGSLGAVQAGQGNLEVDKGSTLGKLDSGPLVRERQVQLSTARQQWASQMEDIQGLLATVSQLHDGLQGMCSREAAAAAAAAEHGVGWPSSSSPAHEAILDFILSTLITPRTVSAVLHAAKKLVGASLMQVSGANGSVPGTLELGPGRLLEPPPNDAETQHSLALLSTALRAVQTCLHASSQLATPALVDKADRAAAAAVAGGAVSPSSGAAASSAAAAAVTLPPTYTSACSPVAPPGARSHEGNAPHQAQQQQQHSWQQRCLDTNRSGVASSIAPAPAHQPSSCGSHAPEGPPQAPAMEHIGHAVQGTANVSHAAETNEPGAEGAQSPSHPSHWSSHLHTLIAQLQWDIGVQRHRRRRAHAAASAARTAAANQRAGLTSPPAGSDAPPPPLAPAAAPAPLASSHTGAAGTAALAMPPNQRGHVPAMTSNPPLANVASDGDDDHNAESSASHALLDPSAAAGSGDGLQEQPLMPHLVPDSIQSSTPADLNCGAASPQSREGRTVVAPPPGQQALQHARTTGEASATGEAVPPVSCDLSSRTGRLRRVHLEDGGVAGLDGSGGGSSGSASPTTLEAAGRRTHMHEVSPLASEIAACLSQDDSAAQEARLRSGAASAAACMPQSASGKVYTSTGAASPTGGDLRSNTAATRRLSSPQGAHNASNSGSLCRGVPREQEEAVALRGLLAEEHEKSPENADLTIPSDCDDDEDDEDNSSSLGSDEDEERGMCPICMDTPISVVVSSCQHGLCVQCAFQLTVKGRELPSCPFCRQKIGGFDWTQPEPMDHTSPSPKRKAHIAPKQHKGQQEKSP